MTPGKRDQPASHACQCTPTQALDRIEQTLIGRRSRVVGTMSLFLYEHLAGAVDELRDADLDEVADELEKLRRDATRGMCTHCSSYDGCPCDAQADQIATGGY